MLLNIFYLCISAYKETVNTVMLRILNAAVVDAAACNNYHIRVISDVEIIIYHLF